jgi:hypothetical protein
VVPGNGPIGERDLVALAPQHHRFVSGVKGAALVGALEYHQRGHGQFLDVGKAQRASN